VTKLWRWRKGRQNAEYDVFTLFSLSLGIGIDAHLIRYRGQKDLPRHRDRVPGKRHFRLNFILGRTC